MYTCCVLIRCVISYEVVVSNFLKIPKVVLSYYHFCDRYEFYVVIFSSYFHFTASMCCVSSWENIA